MTDAARYFRAGELHDRAQREGAKPQRLARLKAWEEHLAEAARQAMRSPWTINDLFAAFRDDFKSN